MESQNQAFHPSHRPCKSRNSSGIYTFPPPRRRALSYQPASTQNQARKPLTWGGPEQNAEVDQFQLPKALAGSVVEIVNGLSVQEETRGSEIGAALEHFGAEVVRLPLHSPEAVCTWVSSLSGLVSFDSFPLHVAHWCRLPTIGLYSASDPAIWGYPNESCFVSIRSVRGQACPATKRDGTCTAFKDPCKFDYACLRMSYCRGCPRWIHNQGRA